MYMVIIKKVSLKRMVRFVMMFIKCSISIVMGVFLFFIFEVSDAMRSMMVRSFVFIIRFCVVFVVGLRGCFRVGWVVGGLYSGVNR